MSKAMKKCNKPTDDALRGAEGPVRMCVICRKRAPKGDLARYVCPRDLAADSLVPDPGRNKPGRGFYVCGEPECRERFGKAERGLMKKCKGVSI